MTFLYKKDHEKIYDRLSIAAFSLAFTGCSDFLEEPIRGQQDLSEYFKTEDECKQQVTGCYQSLFL